jgi:hypothetical protein
VGSGAAACTVYVLSMIPGIPSVRFLFEMRPGNCEKQPGRPARVHRLAHQDRGRRASTQFQSEPGCTGRLKKEACEAERWCVRPAGEPWSNTHHRLLASSPGLQARNKTIFSFSSTFPRTASFLVALQFVSATVRCHQYGRRAAVWVESSSMPSTRLSCWPPSKSLCFLSRLMKPMRPS